MDKQIIKIHENRRTRSIILDTMVLDEYRNYEKRITLFGITIWRRRFTHSLDYGKVVMKSKEIGFFKKSNNEETEKES